MAGEILALAVVLVFALNAFLYYRWKALKDELEEKQSSRTYGQAFALHATVSGRTAKTAGTLASQTGLAEEARRTASELRSIAENDLVQLHQKLFLTDGKIAA